MSISFRIEIDGPSEALNLTNGNAAALLALAGLPSMPCGEIPHQGLEAHIARLLRVANMGALRAPALAEPVETPRWSEVARTDEYLQRRVLDLLELLSSARTKGCGVSWG